MKKLFLWICLLGFTLTSMAQEEKAEPKWADFNGTIAAEKNPKITMIYVYNTPCNLCPNIENKVFADSTVIKALEKDFIATKLFASSQEEYQYKGDTHKYTEFIDDEGVNTLAILLLDGKMGYPTCVFLDENNDKIGTHVYVREVGAMMQILEFYSSGKYVETAFEEWIKEQ
ncbi:MAG: hypothetical protein LBH92_04045 [Bacteroidales bacterium]|jgi:thioredoxin-related protein|nr:hypothetical protein [Bacteroidales bacterium]